MTSGSTRMQKWRSFPAILRSCPDMEPHEALQTLAHRLPMKARDRIPSVGPRSLAVRTMTALLLLLVPIASGDSGDQPLVHSSAPSLVRAVEEVTRASIDNEGGMPRLMINDTPFLPIIFFYNTDIPGYGSGRYMKEQVTLAAQAGVHLYSLPLRHRRMKGGERIDFADSDALMDAFIQIDSQALFILRLFVGPHGSWKEWNDIPAEEFQQFADGTQGRHVSMASSLFDEPTNADMANLIRHYETSPYGKRIVGYHPGGPNSEMFHDHYRTKGPDYSEANHRRFRQWLKTQYRTDQPLQKAWANPDVTLGRAPIPRFESGRFPMHGAGAEEISVFYDLPAEQNWVDFSVYSSDIVADKIIDWARLIKRETQGNKLAVFFYGYTFELPGSFSGHYRLERVLACPEVDILASPYSYHDRFAGGAGGFMSPVDTVAAHGKLWINEDDSRTSALDPALIPSHFSLFDKRAENLHQSVNLLERNLAAIQVHRAGTWWMDLVSAGAFNHPAFWSMLEERMPLYDAVYRRPKPYRPEVAVLVDEESKFYVKSDWDANYWTLVRLRDEAAKTGAAVGYYSLQDFIHGVAPQCKAYVFANAFYLTEEQGAAIRARLVREKATAVWVYAPAYRGPGGPEAGRASDLTGIRLDVEDGMGESAGSGFLEGETWGPALNLSPRLFVADEQARPLGHYSRDGLVSAAETSAPGFRSIFVGDLGLTSGLLRRFFGRAGVHLWTHGGEVVHVDDAVLMAHSAHAGDIAVHLPEGVNAKPIQGKVEQHSASTVHAEFRAGDSRWFNLETQAGPPETERNGSEFRPEEE